MTDTTTPRPLYLDGHLAPVPDEIDAFDLPVTGALPPELTGRYLRNGPNPLPGEDHGHWFAGHGMIHGVRLAGGRARWYRNRWVRTTLLDRAWQSHPARQDVVRDIAANPANTHVIGHAGRLLALCEGGLPYELTPQLDTVGPCDFAGRLTTAMTAHPKELDGKLHFFGYGVVPPYLTYHRLAADGSLEHSSTVDVPGPTMMHDFAVTERHVVWLDLPITFHHDLVGRGMPFQWDDGYGARLGVMAHDGGPVRWFDVDPCYVFHVGNAREDVAGRIVLDVVRYDRDAWDAVWPQIGGTPTRHGGGPAALVGNPGVSRLYRWTLAPSAGTVREQPLDDREVEFPTVHDGHVGRDNRYLYAVSERWATAAIVRYDIETGTPTAYELGAERVAGEAVFVPATGASREDDGWLLSIVTTRSGTASDLLVLDASDVGGAPVAAVHLPRGVPAGFHGSWIADTESEPS